MTARNSLETWVSVESGPFFEVDETHAWSRAALPEAYFEVALSFAGREGFLGQEYLRLYRLEELRALNEAYQISRYRPGLVVFASDGYGEGYAFLRGDCRVLKIPLIPIPVDGEEMEVKAPDFGTFAELRSNMPATLRPNPSTVGLELHLKQPLCFGGGLQDENLVMVTPAQHAELARFWNEAYRHAVNNQGSK